MKRRNSEKKQGKESTTGGKGADSRAPRGPRSFEEELGGGLPVFRDRSGKVHAIKPKAAATAADSTPGRAPRPMPQPRSPGPGAPNASERGGIRREGRPVSRDAKPARPERSINRKPERTFKPRPESEITTKRHQRFESPASDKDRVRGPSKGGRTGEVIKLKAIVDKNRKGFGFLAFENRQYEDAFIPPREAQTLFHGDRVEVTMSVRGEVFNVRVLAHRFRELTGRFSPHPSGPSRGGWVIYERKRAREEVFIPEVVLKSGVKIAEGDWVRTQLEFHESGPHPVTGKVLEVYGPELPASADVSMIANEYNLVEDHPEASEQEAREAKLEIPGRDLVGREDLRKVPFITIDGETARDFDDAVYVERVKEGFVLWVAIADVSHYVKNGSALDADARSRGTSVYFPERAFHMLPRALSENLCSLRPNEPRLTLVARMEYDSVGKRTRTELMEAVIQSKRRATYNEIQVEWDANRNNPKWEFEPQFALYQLIRKSRNDRGSIDFDFPEAELLVEKTGEVISIKNRARVDAHRLIEEFMISANEAVTEWAMARDWPFVYRIHDVPSMQSLEKFQKLAANVGVDFSIGDGSPKVMAELVKRLVGHAASALLNTALLRSMKQAVYSSTHGIHFGLASEGYTHFTSPIRRYPDLVVHRLLRHALRVEKGLEPALNEASRAKLEEELVDITEHCSYRERLASDAERESIKLKQVRLLMKHLGDEFEGKVNGMTENGLFIQLDDPFVEGMIPKDSMTDDFYQFNEERMVFFGRRKKRTFQMGDRVRIRVERADLDRRMVDFGLLDGGKDGSQMQLEASPARAGGGRGGRGGDRERGKERDGKPSRRGEKPGKPGRGGKSGKVGGSGKPVKPIQVGNRFSSSAASSGGDSGLGRVDQRGAGPGFQGASDEAPRTRKGKRDGKGKRRRSR